MLDSSGIPVPSDPTTMKQPFLAAGRRCPMPWFMDATILLSNLNLPPPLLRRRAVCNDPKSVAVVSISTHLGAALELLRRCQVDMHTHVGMGIENCLFRHKSLADFKNI